MSKGGQLTVNEAEIALRAYQIWESEGQPHGKDFEHWLRAETELSKGSADKKSATTARRAPARKPTERKAAERKAPTRKV